MAGKFTSETEGYLIDFFKRHSCLWHPKDDNYFDKEKRNQLLKELCASLLEAYNKEFSVHDIKRKWKYLRSSFARELKRLTSLRSGSGSSMSVKSRWIHFKKMLFLQDNMAADESTDSLVNDQEEMDRVTISAVNSILDDDFDQESHQHLPPVSSGDKFRACLAATRTACTTLARAQDRAPKDNIDAFLMHVNFTLRKMPEYRIQRTMLNIQKLLTEEFSNEEQII